MTRHGLNLRRLTICTRYYVADPERPGGVEFIDDVRRQTTSPNSLYSNVGIPALVFTFVLPLDSPRCVLDCQACHFTRGWFGCGTYFSSVSSLSFNVEGVGSANEGVDADGDNENEEDEDVCEVSEESGLLLDGDEPVALDA